MKKKPKKGMEAPFGDHGWTIFEIIEKIIMREYNGNVSVDCMIILQIISEKHESNSKE